MEESVMGKQIEWDKVAELADKIREQGLSLAEGAKQFGMPVWRLYDLSRRRKHVPDSANEDGCQEMAGSVEAEPPPGSGTVSAEAEAGEDPYALSSLPVEVQQLIIDYRTSDGGAGFKRIEDRLKSDHLVVVNRKQIRQVLKNHGLLAGPGRAFCLITRKTRFDAPWPP